LEFGFKKQEWLTNLQFFPKAFSFELVLRIGKDKKTPTIRSGSFVELEGFEPSSKQAVQMLSTCLSCSFGFGLRLGTGGPIANLSPFDCRPCTRALHDLSRLLLMFPWGRCQASLPGKQMALNNYY
jgi:hypothetical protein